MPDAAEKPPFHEELLLIAEKTGELTDRLGRIETEFSAQTAPLEASRAALDSTVSALTAVLAGIKAVDSHVLSTDIGAVSKRLSEVASQSDVTLRGFEQRLGALNDALGEFRAATDRQLSAFGAQRVELEQKHAAETQEFASRVGEVRNEIARLQETLLARVEAARREFAEPRSFNPRGKYDGQGVYSRLDVVELNGSSFVSIEDNNSEKPGGASKKWQTLARRGSAGIGGGGTQYDPAGTQILTDVETVTWNTAQGPIASLTLGGNRTLSIGSTEAGKTYVLFLKQDGTGSRTVTWPSDVVWPGGTAPTLTTTAGRTDIITFTSNGTKLLGSYVLNYNV